MIFADINDTSIEAIEASKSFFGKISIKKINRIEIQPGEKWEQKITSLLTSKEISFTIPDTKSYTIRLKLPLKSSESEILNKALEIIPNSASEIVYDFKRLPAEILFTAALKSHIETSIKSFQALKIKPVLAIPESIAIFEIIKSQIQQKRVLYVDVGAITSTVSLHDRFGPVLSVSEPVQTQKLEQEINKFLIYSVEKIILGGGNSINLDPNQLANAVKIPVMKADGILSKIFSPSGASPQVLFLNCYGLILYSKNRPEINLLT